MPYFYKGYRIVARADGKYVVVAPEIGNKPVKIADSKIAAKIWIEGVDSQFQLIQANKELERILGGNLYLL